VAFVSLGNIFDLNQRGCVPEIDTCSVFHP
jgi:hypothetical protein